MNNSKTILLIERGYIIGDRNRKLITINREIKYEYHSIVLGIEHDILYNTK